MFRSIVVVLSAAVLAAAGPAVTASAQPGHHEPPSPAPGGDRIGLLIADHGEPPEYNELTYWSFRKFFEHLMGMGLVPGWLRALDSGTVLQDPGCYACAEPRLDGDRIDAWLRPQPGPGLYVPGSERLEAHYVMPGGPGLGEPDIFEHVGLGTWHEWQLMGGRSPNYEQKLVRKRAVIRRLRARYGPELPIRIGYGIDPRIAGGRQGIREAVAALVRRDRVSRIVMAYHGVGFSDLMQTHMLRHEAEAVARELDPSVELTYAEPMGASDMYVRSVVAKVRRELRGLAAAAPVAIHLSGHGLPTGKCGDYDCGGDAYHDFSRALFERTRRAIERGIRRSGRLGVFHVYGDGAADADDPGDEVDSPIEALDKRAAHGFQHVIDVPYEFDADSRDTLIVLRRGYGRPIPHWDHRLESRFTYQGLDVKITNASFGRMRKTRALEMVVRRALERAGSPPDRKIRGGREHHRR
jgi:hypothetical protein